MNKLLKVLGIIKAVSVEVYTIKPQLNDQPQPRKPLANFVKRAGKFFIFTDKEGKQTRCNTLKQSQEYACIYAAKFSSIAS